MCSVSDVDAGGPFVSCIAFMNNNNNNIIILINDGRLHNQKPARPSPCR